MATRKYRKSKSRKGRTARRRRTSTAGKVYPPLDVRSKKDLVRLGPLVKNGNLTIFLVWAKWCPHCHTMMPHFDAASKSPSRTINSVKVEEQMLPAVNQILATQVNKAAKPLNVEGFPSIIVVDKNANKVADLEPVRDTAVMTQVMANAGPLANKAGLTNENVQNAANMIATPDPEPMNRSTNTNINMNLNSSAAKRNKNKAFLANLGLEEEGMAAAEAEAVASPKNIDIGEENLLGSIASKNNKPKPIKLNSLSTNALASTSTSTSANKVPKNTLKEATAPSTLNTFNSAKEVITPPPASIKKLSEEAEEVTSLASPLVPPSAVNDLEENRNVPSISNSLTAEQKVSGGSYGERKGGSLYASLARTTYTLAPAAALLATAAVVMRGKKRVTHKRSKKSRRSQRRRR